MAGAEGKPKWLRHDAELRRRDVGAEAKPKLHGAMLSCDGTRLERRRRRSCCEAATA
jgi:hypothetical protein